MLRYLRAIAELFGTVLLFTACVAVLFVVSIVIVIGWALLCEWLCSGNYAHRDLLFVSPMVVGIMWVTVSIIHDRAQQLL